MAYQPRNYYGDHCNHDSYHEIGRLRAEIETLTRRYNLARREHEEQATELNDLNQAQAKDIRHLKRNQEALEKQNKDLIEQLGQAQAQIDSYDRQLQALEEDKHRRRKDARQKDDKIAKLDEENDRLRDERRGLQTDRGNLQLQCENLQAQLDASSSSDSIRIDKLNDKIDRWRAKYASIVEAIQEKDRQQDERERQHRLALGRLEQERDVAVSQASASDATRDQEYKELLANYDTLKAANDQLLGYNLQWKETCDNKDKEILSLRGKLDEANSKYRQKKARLDQIAKTPFSRNRS